MYADDRAGGGGSEAAALLPHYTDGSNPRVADLRDLFAEALVKAEATI